MSSFNEMAIPILCSFSFPWSEEIAMLYDEYARACIDARSKYGDRSAVLIEVGSFYELYAVGKSESSERDEPVESEIRDVAATLDLTVTKKNKSNPSSGRENPFMCGFPSVMIEKYLDVLVCAGFTVSVMSQEKTKLKLGSSSSSSQFYRRVTRVVSPGTHVPNSADVGQNQCSQDSSHLVVVYLSSYGSSDSSSFGMACTDVTTGAVHVYEPESRRESMDEHAMKEDLFRVLCLYKPVELMFVGEGWTSGVPDLMEFLELSCVRLVHDRTGNRFESFKVFGRLEYQHALLRKAYPTLCESLLSPSEVFDLETRPLGSIALCALLQFVYEHGEGLVTGLQRPFVSSAGGPGACSCLVLKYNSCVQLNLISGNSGSGSGNGGSGSGNGNGNGSQSVSRDKSFLTQFNQCMTPMGRREFRRRLLCPTTDTTELQRRYDGVSKMMTDTGPSVREHLKGLPDLERLCRKLGLGSLSYKELLTLCEGSSRCLQLEAISQDAGRDVASACVGFVDSVRRTLHSKGPECSDEESLALSLSLPGEVPCFRAGHDSELDRLRKVLISSEMEIRALCVRLNAEHGGQEWYRVESTDRDGFFLGITRKRHEDRLRTTDQEHGRGTGRAGTDSISASIRAADLERLPGSGSGANIRLTHDWLRRTNDSINSSRSLAVDLARSLYIRLVSDLSQSFRDSLMSLLVSVVEADLTSTSAHLARRHGWVRPVLAGSDTAVKSFVRTEGLRHPIIESILTRHEYVPNDVTLGSEIDGLLLFGINAVGKSSFMKSIGVSIVMAQAGLFVAASRFEFRPYESLFTRIVSSDNLYAGRSTFTSEMLELRTILRCADGMSLVIGDELCSGTERVSAVSLVGAGLDAVSRSGASFVFATHLHELTRADVLSHLPRLRVCHLSVHYDSHSASLVYDRVLREGPGDTLYGLEVCKALDLDQEFMACAFGIRRRLLGESDHLVRPKTSRYSSQLYMDVCEVCRTAMSSETHHIRRQKGADAMGLLEGGRMHKNVRFNLLAVCDACHDKIHGSDNPREAKRTHQDSTPQNDLNL
jgi:DNA mismatch repair protein MutS